MVSEAELGPDEAQYWFWSQEFAFGYFSKPPLIAWTIGATTALFGNAEWAVRLSAPLFHFGAAAFLYLAARAAFDRRIAFWTGLSWLTIPGVILSSFLITTDAPLLFFWSGALFFLLRIASDENPQRMDFAALGVMVGLGFLSKYAMAYFPAAIAAATLFDGHFRRKILRPPLILTAAAMALLIAPNLWWNAQNNFQTVSHTAANANWGAALFAPLKLLTFAAQQFAVAGAVPLVALVVIAFQPRRFFTGDPAKRNIAKLLLVFALTPLAIVAVQAFISRAHANWAAAAYPAVILLTTAILFRHKFAWLVKASVALHLLFLLFFTAGIANLSILDQVHLSRTAKEIRGWEIQTNAIAAMADGFDAIVIDDRSLMGAMLFYQGEDAIEVVTIDANAHVGNHYEAFKAFDPNRHRRVLFVTTRDDDAHVEYRFKNIVPLGPQTVDLGNGLTRTYHLFDISGYFGPGAP